jgi:PBP1b-binding outer membrane lipoprotein LpoB
MSRTVALILLVALLISACAGTEIKADVADNPQAQATKALVEKFIKTNLAYDSQGLIFTPMSLSGWIMAGTTGHSPKKHSITLSVSHF